MINEARENCRRGCEEDGDDPCGCGSLETYDVGNFLFNMAAHYLAVDGKELSIDLCNSRGDCPGFLPRPEERDVSEFP